jgi:UDP-N-acetylmuramate dehydrogenase
MPAIKEHISLKPFNTFGMEVYCDYFTEITSETDFIELLENGIYQTQRHLILGGGSNVLLTRDFKGMVIRNTIKGIEIVKKEDSTVHVKAAAGEVWHDFVMWTIAKGLGGLENLSLIPGCVGASPMQNIGAYGVEIKDVFVSLEALHMVTGEKRVFNREACEFGYRESVFKRKFKDQYFITSVTFELSERHQLSTTYGAIQNELQAMGITSPGIRDVSDAVIRIRRSKLPDPAEMGNAGSFFKNPEVPADQYTSLKTHYPDLVGYPLENGHYKLAAGWLIEQCGLKGHLHNGAAVHDKQALVLVNKAGCSGQDVFDLSTHVLKTVHEKFGVELEREVNII